MSLLQTLREFSMHDVQVARMCADCLFFDSNPARIEAVMSGLNSLSSGYASVRGDDGLCAKHQRILGATSHCQDSAPRSANR